MTPKTRKTLTTCRDVFAALIEDYAQQVTDFHRCCAMPDGGIPDKEDEKSYAMMKNQLVHARVAITTMNRELARCSQCGAEEGEHWDTGCPDQVPADSNLTHVTTLETTEGYRA